MKKIKFSLILICLLISGLAISCASMRHYKHKKRKKPCDCPQFSLNKENKYLNNNTIFKI